MRRKPRNVVARKKQRDAAHERKYCRKDKPVIARPVDARTVAFAERTAHKGLTAVADALQKQERHARNIAYRRVAGYGKFSADERRAFIDEYERKVG